MGASVFQKERECLICGNPNAQEHHMIHGTANRSIADKYGLCVYLCLEHHTGPHGVHFNRAFDVELHQMAQKYFESHIGDRERWIQEFGKSWL